MPTFNPSSASNWPTEEVTTLEESFMAVLSGVGFPAAVSFYLLVKVSNSLDELTEAITRLDTRLEERISRRRKRKLGDRNNFVYAK